MVTLRERVSRLIGRRAKVGPVPIRRLKAISPYFELRTVRLAQKSSLSIPGFPRVRFVGEDEGQPSAPDTRPRGPVMAYDPTTLRTTRDHPSAGPEVDLLRTSAREMRHLLSTAQQDIVRSVREGSHRRRDPADGS